MTRGAARCSKKSRLSSVDVAARSTSTGVATLRYARVTRGGPLPSRAARDAPRLREVRDDPLRRRHVPRRVDAAVPRLGRGVVVERRRRRASIIRRVGCDDRRDAVALLRRLDVVPSSRLSPLAFSPSAAHRVREPHRADVAVVRDPRRRRRSRLSVIRRTRTSFGGSAARAFASEWTPTRTPARAARRAAASRRRRRAASRPPSSRLQLAVAA